MWKTIKKVIPSKNKVSVSNVKIDDKFTSNDIDTANAFNSYFTTIGADLAKKFDHDDNDTCTDSFVSTNKDSHSNFSFQYISVEYVYDQILNLSNSKSPGVDNIDVKLIKTAASVICYSLAYICNLSLATSVFPSEWKKAKVIPVFKSGSKTNVGNYRPISVLSIVSKVIERAVHDQVYSYLTDNNLLSSSQSGFRSQYSTATTVIDVQDYILKNMNEGNVTGAIFLDLKKAFDTVNHGSSHQKTHEIWHQWY